MNEELIKQLIATLESIDASLSMMQVSLERMEENLDGCIAQNGHNKFICITGNIDSY